MVEVNSGFSMLSYLRKIINPMKKLFPEKKGKTTLHNSLHNGRSQYRLQYVVIPKKNINAIKNFFLEKR